MKKMIVLTFLYIQVFAIYAQITLPVVLPEDATGMEVTFAGTPNTYRIQLEYSLKPFVDTKDTTKSGFILPVPCSTQYQTVTIVKTNTAITDITRDQYGNVVLITEPVKPTKIKDVLIVICEITVNTAQYSFPTGYFYTIDYNKTAVKHLTENSGYAKVQGKIKKIAQKLPDAYTYDDLFTFINLFKEEVNKAPDAINKIYREKVINLYPIPDKQYLMGALNLLALLKKQGINGRIGFGWNVVPRLPVFSRDFIIEIYIPDKGFLVLDKYLNLFSNRGYFILWHYDMPEAYTPGFGYTGRLGETDIRFTENEVCIRAGLMHEGMVNDPRFKAVSDYVAASSRKKSNRKAFLIEEVSFVADKDSLGIFTVNSERHYATTPVSQYCEEVVLCLGVSNHKPVQASMEFKAGERIHAYLKFASTKSNKIGIVKWIKPDGSIFHNKKIDIPGNWGYSYTYIHPRELGLWTLELYLYGKLESRKHFTVQ